MGSIDTSLSGSTFQTQLTKSLLNDTLISLPLLEIDLRPSLEKLENVGRSTKCVSYSKLGKISLPLYKKQRENVFYF